MNFIDFLQPELAILPLVLYFFGVCFKRTKGILDWKIPFILVGIGIALATIYLLAISIPLNTQDILMLIFSGFTQGAIATAVAVLANQFIQQGTTGRAEDIEEASRIKMLGEQ